MKVIIRVLCGFFLCLVTSFATGQEVYDDITFDNVNNTLVVSDIPIRGLHDKISDLEKTVAGLSYSVKFLTNVTTFLQNETHYLRTQLQNSQSQLTSETEEFLALQYSPYWTSSADYECFIVINHVDFATDPSLRQCGNEIGYVDPSFSGIVSISHDAGLPEGISLSHTSSGVVVSGTITDDWITSFVTEFTALGLIEYKTFSYNISVTNNLQLTSQEPKLVKFTFVNDISYNKLNAATPARYDVLGVAGDTGAGLKYAGNAMALSNDGQILVVGVTPRDESGQDWAGGFYVFKWDSIQGRFLYQSHYGGAATEYRMGKPIEISEDGSVLYVNNYNYPGPANTYGGAVSVYDKTSDAPVIYTFDRLIVGVHGALSYGGYFMHISRDGATLAYPSFRADVGCGANSGSISIYENRVFNHELTSPHGCTVNGEFGVKVQLSDDALTLVVYEIGLSLHWLDSGALWVFTREARGDVFANTQTLISPIVGQPKLGNVFMNLFDPKPAIIVAPYKTSGANEANTTVVRYEYDSLAGQYQVSHTFDVSLIPSSVRVFDGEWSYMAFASPDATQIVIVTGNKFSSEGRAFHIAFDERLNEFRYLSYFEVYQSVSELGSAFNGGYGQFSADNSKFVFSAANCDCVIQDGGQVFVLPLSSEQANDVIPSFAPTWNPMDVCALPYLTN